MSGLLKLAGLAAGIMLAACATQTPSAGRLPLLLAAQGFTSSLEPELDLRPLVSVTTASDHYDVYYYRHITTQMAAPRGLHLLVVVQNGDTYRGSYLIDDDPTKVVHVAGSDIVFDYPGGPGENRLHFDENGPPKSVVIDGVYSELTK